MHMRKTLADQAQKYTVKYNGTIVTTRLQQVQSIMQARYESTQSVIYNIVELVRDTLSNDGIPSALWASYISFAEKIAKLSFKFKGATLANEVSAVKSFYVTAWNLNPAELDKIAQIVLGQAPPY